MKNNLSARCSRSKRKDHEQEVLKKVECLSNENFDLKIKNATLEATNCMLEKTNEFFKMMLLPPPQPLKNVEEMELYVNYPNPQIK